MENRQIAALGGFFLLLVVGILFFINMSSQTPKAPDNSNLNLGVTSAPAQNQEVTSLQITDEKIGTGEAVKAGDTITVNYTGALLNGQVFDSTSGKSPFTTQIGVGKVIQGWDEGIIGMKVGGMRKLVIPASLGYGAQAQGPIPANSPLIFEISLISIDSPSPMPTEPAVSPTGTPTPTTGE